MRYEILNSLPPYGPMYIPISDTHEPFYSEGFVVRFFKNDKTNWVANFREGITGFNKIFDFPEKNRIIVFARGIAYIVDPNLEKGIGNFGFSISDVFQTQNGSLICVDLVRIIILDNITGEIWESERISWDGFKDIIFDGNTIHGLSYDPTNSIQEWSEFSFDITTREIKGGSFRDMLENNPQLGIKNRVELKTIKPKTNQHGSFGSEKASLQHYIYIMRGVVV